jgi:hypothetical protein
MNSIKGAPVQTDKADEATSPHCAACWLTPPKGLPESTIITELVAAGTPPREQRQRDPSEEFGQIVVPRQKSG